MTQTPDVDVVARARELTAQRPELSAVLDLLERLDDIELARHPETFDQIHQVLRTALANAGDVAEPLPVDPAGDDHA